MRAAGRTDLSGTPEPDGSDPKEIYAFAGLALHHAQLLEQELQLFAAALDLSARTSISHQDVDALWDELSVRTLGQLLRAAGKWIQLPDSLARDLDEAVRVRNVVCHSFFADHAEDMLSETGRLELVDWLREAAAIMSAAEQRVMELRRPLWQSLGITEEMAAAEFEAAVARADARDRP